MYSQSFSVKFCERAWFWPSIMKSWLHHLPLATRFTLIYIFLVSLLEQDPLERGGYTTNTMYKSATIGISSFGKQVLCVSMSRCRSNKNVWAQAWKTTCRSTPSQPVVVEQKKKSQTLLIKATKSQRWDIEKRLHFNKSHWWESWVKWWERRLTRRNIVWLLGRQYQLLSKPPSRW